MFVESLQGEWLVVVQFEEVIVSIVDFSKTVEDVEIVSGCRYEGIEW